MRPTRRLAALVPFAVAGLLAPVAWMLANLARPPGVVSERALWIALPSLAGALLVAYGLGWPAGPRMPRGASGWTPVVAGAAMGLIAAGLHTGYTNWIFPRTTDDAYAMGVGGLAVLIVGLGLSLRLPGDERDPDGRHTAMVAGTFLWSQWLLAQAMWALSGGRIGGGIGADAIDHVPELLALVGILIVLLAALSQLPLYPRRGVACVLPVLLIAFNIWSRGLMLHYVLPALALAVPAARELWVEGRTAGWRTGPSP